MSFSPAVEIFDEVFQWLDRQRDQDVQMRLFALVGHDFKEVLLVDKHDSATILS